MIKQFKELLNVAMICLKLKCIITCPKLQMTFPIQKLRLCYFPI